MARSRCFPEQTVQDCIIPEASFVRFFLPPFYSFERDSKHRLYPFHSLCPDLHFEVALGSLAERIDQSQELDRQKADTPRQSHLCKFILPSLMYSVTTY